MPVEQPQFDALQADVIDGRKKVYSKIEGLEDRVSELRTEVHGLSVRADEREKRHDEWRAEIRGQFKDLNDSFIKAQRETASFNRELLEAVRTRGNHEPPSPPPVPVGHPAHPPQREPTFAEQLNALDWRWTAAAVVAALALGGALTASDTGHIVRAFFPAPAVANQTAPAAAP
jgi:hypothetical protein